MVRKRAEQKLPGSEADEVDADYKLPVVLVTDAKRVPDLRERGEHHVDGERRQRHEKRDQRYELEKRQRKLSRLRHSFLGLREHEADLIS
jgi:hypothetical protein